MYFLTYFSSPARDIAIPLPDGNFKYAISRSAVCAIKSAGTKKTAATFFLLGALARAELYFADSKEPERDKAFINNACAYAKVGLTSRESRTRVPISATASRCFFRKKKIKK